MKLSEKEIIKLLNYIDWLNFRTKKNETLLFKLVKMRHSEVIIHILNQF